MQEQPIGLCQCGCGLATPLATNTRHERGQVKGQPIKYLHGHHRRPTGPEYVVDETTGCWAWQRGTNSNGYGVGWEPSGRERYAHRIYFRRFKGDIPPDLVIDHLCRNRACVNPEHMELVTNGENVLRGQGPSARAKRVTHCKLGHSLSGDNLYVSPGGKRGCRKCRVAAAKASERRTRQARDCPVEHRRVCMFCGRTAFVRGPANWADADIEAAFAVMGRLFVDGAVIGVGCRDCSRSRGSRRITRRDRRIA